MFPRWEKFKTGIFLIGNMGVLALFQEVLTLLEDRDKLAQLARQTLEFARKANIQLPVNPEKHIRSIARGNEIPEYVKEGVKTAIQLYRYGRSNPRTIYYTLVQKGLLPKTKKALDHLTDWLTALRLIGAVPFELIHDAGREELGGDYEFESPEDYINRKLETLMTADKYYKLPKWYKQPYYVEVWCEKLGLKDFVYKALLDLNVRIRFIRGYTAWGLIYRAVEWFKTLKDRKIVILHLGDFDPSGEDIVRRAIESIKYFGFNVEYRKLAVTLEQVDKYNLPEKPEGEKGRKTLEKAMRDPRYEWFVRKHGKLYVVELETLFTPDRIDETINMIRNAVLEYYDKNIAEEVRREEERLREKVRHLVEEIKGKLGGTSNVKRITDRIAEVKERRGRLKRGSKVYIKREGYIQLTLPVEYIGKRVRVIVETVEDSGGG